MPSRKKDRPKVSPEVVAWEREPDFDTRAMTVPVDSPEFQLAVSKYPQCEVDRNHEIVRQGMGNRPNFGLPSKAELVRGRWENPICHNCMRKPQEPCEEADVTLTKCTACHLVWYCSKDCQRADWVKAHKKWCTNLPNVTEVDPECPYQLRVVSAEWSREDRLAVLEGKVEVPLRVVPYPPSD
ncbi:hypothetical protein KFL_003800080 [Klebsormidium nitens]|uniref:MYND-type domain-containing protein n=1 Tax=Klebsormidium nitens TaxID=105231 RepID=A0A1Y1ID08_KLENI|nr:hypothetical protein KFL_003800080 [Klebsormidium nitens]|eukprot:GAQ87832.1 hypothetical protein KFL_003800080 [Klebsormidium nitens]